MSESIDTDTSRALAALQQRVDALEQENTRLRRPSPAPGPLFGGSRRQVLLGGAGVLGALAGGLLAGRPEPAMAAPIEAPQTLTTEKHLGLQISMVPLKSRGVLWATHEWDLGRHFTAAHVPIVVATAWDDELEHDVASFCVCAVRVHGTPGAYRATILVRNISPFATEVVVNALALGA